MSWVPEEDQNSFAWMHLGGSAEVVPTSRARFPKRTALGLGGKNLSRVESLGPLLSLQLSEASPHPLCRLVGTVSNPRAPRNLQLPSLPPPQIRVGFLFIFKFAKLKSLSRKLPWVLN